MKYFLLLLLILITFFTAVNYANSQTIRFGYSYGPGTYSTYSYGVFSHHSGLNHSYGHAYYRYHPGHGLYYQPYQPYPYHSNYRYQPYGLPQIYTVPHVFPFR